jgi:hypothetical protein
MAKPAFIYAFDNLGPYRFTELCGELLGSQYNGFLLGGEGADGGIDGEIDSVLGVWHPESRSSLLNELVQPGQTVVFQFKHKTTARVGQSQSREQLLNLYKCNAKTGKICELHRKLVQEKKPTSYILVTNAEVNAQFRDTFIQKCKIEQPSIKHYQVIGLDELVGWVEMSPELRHLYFPTIFGMPRFDLRITASLGFTSNYEELGLLLAVNVLNVGTIPSYLDANSIKFDFLIDGKREIFSLVYINDPVMQQMNPKTGMGLEPGRKQTYWFQLAHFAQFREKGRNIFPVEIQVHDEIGNVYREPITENIREALLENIYGKKES